MPTRNQPEQKKTFIIYINENTLGSVGGIRGIAVKAASLHQAVTMVAKMVKRAAAHCAERGE